MEVDPRLNNATKLPNRRRKFQPDVLVRDSNHAMLLAVDIESPNSSDARLLPKDVDAYVEWTSEPGQAVFPYLVITMLPGAKVKKRKLWPLCWRDGYNWAHKEKRRRFATILMPTGTASSVATLAV